MLYQVIVSTPEGEVEWSQPEASDVASVMFTFDPLKGARVQLVDGKLGGRKHEVRSRSASFRVQLTVGPRT